MSDPSLWHKPVNDTALYRIHDLTFFWSDFRPFLFNTYPPRPCPALSCTCAAITEMTRYFNVFLPAGFRSDKRYPVWMHIHGVYWGSMDDISGRMGWNVLAMDATANWDGLVGSDKVYNSAIVVYPQSTPSPYEDTSKRMVRT